MLHGTHGSGPVVSAARRRQTRPGAAALLSLSPPHTFILLKAACPCPPEWTLLRGAGHIRVSEQV